MHFFGLVFMCWQPTKDFFLGLTPLNLLLSGAFLFYYHPTKDKNFWLYVLLFCGVGFGVEVLGVHTGLIFGNYWYGKSLGFKCLEVPLLIGLNWGVLVVMTASLTETFFYMFPLRTSTWIEKTAKATLAAAQMTLLDVIIEPIAMHLDFWQWQNSIVPFQNYVAWFVVGFLLHLVYQQSPIRKRNPLALYLVVAQIIFFSGFSLVLLRT